MAQQTNSLNETKANGTTTIAQEKLLQVPVAQDGNASKSANETDQIDLPTADVVVPIDGGWGWVVVASSFFCTLIVDGIVMNASVVSNEIEKEFGISTSKVSKIDGICGDQRSNCCNLILFFFPFLFIA